MIGCGIGLTRVGVGGAPAPEAWTPDLLPARFVDLDAERGPVVVAGRVVSELDQSGAGNTALSLDAASDQPVVSTAPGLLGQTSVYYGGSAYQRTALEATPSEFTFFLVIEPDVDTAQVWLSTGTNGGGNRLGQGIDGPTIEDWLVGNTFSTDGPAAAAGLSIVYSSQAGPTPGARLWVNGLEVILSAADTAALAVSGVLIFGAAVEGPASGLYFAGHRCRLVGCDGRALPEDIANWFAWSLAKYGK